MEEAVERRVGRDSGDRFGAPLFVPVTLATFDAGGAFANSATVPSGLAGIDVGLRSFAQAPAEGNVASGLVHVLFR